MKRRPFIRFIWIGVLLALFIVIVEWAGHGGSKDLARLERILALLQVHPDFLWRQRPNLDTAFEGAAVVTDSRGFRVTSSSCESPEDSFQIVALGASPTFGYGVEADQAYPGVAQSRLRRDYPNVEIENAGQVGYSSLQGLRLFKRYVEIWSPDLITVSYVVNDIDRLRFFFSNGRDDDRTEPPSPCKAKISNLLRRFWPTAYLLRNQRRILLKLTVNRSRRGQYELTHVRSRADNYERNLRQFVEICRERDIRLVFIKMPFRLPEAIPAEVPGVGERVKEVEKRILEGEREEAREIIDSILQQDPHGSLPYYLKGRLLEGGGDASGAKEAYDSAMEHLICDCARDARRYNAIMETVAQESGIPLVDPTTVLGDFKANMAFFLPGDYIHPNPEGHTVIGNCLAKAIARALSGERGWFVEECK